MIISYDGDCLIPYFAFLSRHVVRFVGSNDYDDLDEHLGQPKISHLRDRVDIFKYETGSDIVLEANKGYNKKFSLILFFEALPEEKSYQLLQNSIPEAFILILDQCFQTFWAFLPTCTFVNTNRNAL